MLACREKEEAIVILPKVSTGVSFCELSCRQTWAALSCRWLHRYPPVASCIFMYVALCTRRESVGKHGVYVWVMVWWNSVGIWGCMVGAV